MEAQQNMVVDHPGEGSPWHNLAYKKMVTHLMLQTVTFFTVFVTFLFHTKGLAFWQCALKSSCTGDVQSLWTTTSSVSSGDNTRTLTQTLVTAAIEVMQHSTP